MKVNVGTGKKDNFIKVSTYTGLIGDYGTKGGTAFPDEDRGKLALFKLMQNGWDGEIRTD